MKLIKMKSITKDEYREAKKHWDNYRGKYMEQLQNEMEIAKENWKTAEATYLECRNDTKEGK